MLIARATFALSIAASLFWIFGIAVEHVTGAEPPVWSYLGPALIVTLLCCWALFRYFPEFLRPSPSVLRRFLLLSGLSTLLAYLAGMALVGASMFLLLEPDLQPTAALRSETTLVVYLLAFWLPLWFSPAIGLALGWWWSSTVYRE